MAPFAFLLKHDEIKARHLVGVLRSPDRFGSITTAQKVLGLAWAMEVMVLTVNSAFPADSTPEVT